MARATARTAAQEAAIKADLKKQRELRNEEPKQPEQVIADSVSPEEGGMTAEMLKQAAAEAFMKLLGVDENAPSWKRKLAAFFAVGVVAYGIGYGIGTLAGYAIAGIAALGGSVLWSYLIMITALIVSLYAGVKVGQYLGNYILSGQIDADIGAIKNKVTGWFKRDKKDAPQIAVAAS